MPTCIEVVKLKISVKVELYGGLSADSDYWWDKLINQNI